MGGTGGPRCRPAVAYLGEDYPVSCVFIRVWCAFTRVWCAFTCVSCAFTSRLPTLARTS
jgi:hypothetical protein